MDNTSLEAKASYAKVANVAVGLFLDTAGLDTAAEMPLAAMSTSNEDDASGRQTRRSILEVILAHWVILWNFEAFAQVSAMQFKQPLMGLMQFMMLCGSTKKILHIEGSYN